jgi:CheY-like chemotaxis protein
MSFTRSLRILHLEDNPLIAFHIEQMIEDLGHIPAATFSSFAELEAAPELAVDCAFVDIDLSDGRTGPDAVRWLRERGVPSIFVTGQVEIAHANSELVVAFVAKPVSMNNLASALEKIHGNPADTYKSENPLP